MIYPGKDYVLKYRMLVFDGELPADLAEAVWQQYAMPVSMTWIE
jgi:hypothetical protein